MLVHLRATDAKRVPWKNGRGSTLELARDDDGSGGWSWRLSIADVPEDGPFSEFPGVERSILCLDGRGMRLDGPHGARLVPHEGEALVFQGEEPVRGLLVDGPVRDLNLMVRRDRWSGRLSLVRGPIATRIEPAPLAVVHAVSGRATAFVGPHGAHELQAGESLLVSDLEADVAGDGVVAIALVSGRASGGSA
jgi:environmental stress-induced protein Ves